jgi:hypothetical protein
MLIKTINEVKDVLPVGAANNYARLKPHFEAAELAFIKPLLGTSMYDELQEFYDDYEPAEPPGDELSEEHTEAISDTVALLKKVQHAISHLAYFLGFDLLNIQVSDMGFKRSESETAKTLFKYQEDNLRDFFKTTGFNALDNILLFLEENISSFGEFASAPNYTVLKTSFIPNTSVFNDIVFIHNSRIIFLRLIPHMRFVEDTILRPALTETVYASVKSGMVATPVPVLVTSTLAYLRPALAHFSAAMLMEESGADMSDRGLFFQATMATAPDNRQITPAASERIALLVARSRQMGNHYLTELKAFLNAYWPGYSGTPGPFRRDNYNKKSFWA